ncbi:MAG: OmpP1/FadL family transporter, partial [Chthoniobacterales bacterium]
ALAGGAAQAEDASDLIFKQARIPHLNKGEFQHGAHQQMPSANYSNQGSRYNLPGTPFNGLPVAGTNNGDAGVDHLLGNIYLTQPIMRSQQYGDLSVGAGLSSPFGLETDWGPDWVGRYAALRTKLTTIDIQPTIAYRIFERLSFGASFDAQYASARLSQAIDFGLAAQQPLAQFFTALPAALAAQGVPPAAIPGVIHATQQAYAAAGFVPGGNDGVSEVHGDNWDWGFTLGAMFEYLKKGEDTGFLQDGRVGFSYRYGIHHDIDGDADFRRVPLITAPGAPVQFPQPGAFQSIFFPQGAMASIQLPDVFHFSIYQRFAHQFAIMGDVTWTRWSQLDTVPIEFANPGTPSNVLNINYQDSQRYAIGFEWYTCPALTLRAGFAYDETPIRSDEFRTPRIPDNDRYMLSVGAKWAATSWMDFDLAYAHLFVDEPRSDFTDNQGHELIGKYDAHVDIVSASVTFKWGGPAEVTRTTYSKDSGKNAAGYRK